MSKIKFIEFNGKKYPVSFSLMATKMIARKFGSLEKMESAISSGEVTESAIDAISFVASTLIHQGCAYLNCYEKDVEPYENAPYENGKYIPVTAEEIETLLQFDEIELFMEELFDVIGIGDSKHEEEDIPKNTKATQG